MGNMDLPQPTPEVSDGLAMWLGTGYALSGARDPMLDRRSTPEFIKRLHNFHSRRGGYYVDPMEEERPLHAQYCLLEIRDQLPGWIFPPFHYPFTETEREATANKDKLREVQQQALRFLHDETAPEVYFKREHFIMWFIAEYVKDPIIPPPGVTEFIFNEHAERDRGRKSPGKHTKFPKPKEIDDIRDWLGDKVKRKTPEAILFHKYAKFIKADKKHRHAEFLKQ